MCGIAGWVGETAGAEEGVVRMTDSLARRGPNSTGKHIFGKAVFGHRRLSIFDLSDAGNQPMVTPDGQIGVVFNGAIYNFRELRSELEAVGCRFHSKTDTEVLLYGYREWGLDELVKRLRGMFAFGLWDEKAQRLSLVRDRLGVKPLVYGEKNGALVFASTVKAVHAAGVGTELDEDAVAEFLQRGYISDDRAIWKGIRKLPAGHLLVWEKGRVQRFEEYWRPPAAEDRSRVSFEEIVEEVERLLLQAVERRLSADVKVGALLSGGIDSTLVCWAIRKLGADVTAFTVSAPGDVSDESQAASETARRLGLPHEVVALSTNEPVEVDELISAYGEPFACGSALGMLRVSQAVRPSATVLLTGDGGDDVFLGYTEHRACWVAQQIAAKIPLSAGGLGKRVAGQLKGRLRRTGTLLELATGGVAGYQRRQDRFGFYESRGMLGERLKGKRSPEPEAEDSLEGGRRLMHDFLEQDRKLRFVGEFMTKVDGGTMHYALEARSPFLDQDLWEYAARLPYGVRLRKGVLKAVLRDLTAKRIGVPEAQRRKQGFTIPVGRWLAGDWRARTEEAFRNSRAGELGLLNSAALGRELDRHKEQAPLELWYAYVLENWLRAEYLQGVRR